MCDHCASTDGARRAQNCALYTSVCFVVSVPLFAMCSRLFMSVCRSQMFVNMRCRIHSLYRQYRANEDGHKTQSQVIESTRGDGSPQCGQKETGNLRSRSQCPSVCHMSTLPFGHVSNPDPDDDSSKISATSFSPSSCPCHSRRRNQQQWHPDPTSCCTLL